jgi:hypothetical protein
VLEAALAHAVGDSTEFAYRRGTFEKRRELMNEWASYLLGSGAGGRAAGAVLRCAVSDISKPTAGNIGLC